jgi:hypothetical protein
MLWMAVRRSRFNPRARVLQERESQTVMPDQ